MGEKIDKEWLIEQLELVFQFSDDLVALNEETGPAYNSKSVLKLAKLAGAVQLYTKIISKREWESHYIDALAGAGVMELDSADEYIISSPIIAPAVATEHFDHYHYFEENEDRVEALRQRLEYISDETEIGLDRDQWTIYQGDSNEEIPPVMDRLVRKSRGDGPALNLFRFVDNEGRNIDWSTIQSKAQIWGDFLITFPTHSMPRDAGRVAIEESDKRADGLTGFFGTPSWEDCNSPDDFAELYENRLADVDHDKLTIRTRVRGSDESRGAYYDSIWATRETDRGSPYREAIEHVNQRIERSDGGVVDAFFENFVHGNQASFDLYDRNDGFVGLDHFED